MKCAKFAFILIVRLEGDSVELVLHVTDPLRDAVHLQILGMQEKVVSR